ncbi:hypothetical protein Droror1_Dr00024577, partial [Drosera rotundifolia]
MAHGRESSKPNWKQSGKKEFRGRSSSKGARDLSRVQCFYYKSFGHFKSECPKLKARGGEKLTWQKSFGRKLLWRAAPWRKPSGAIGCGAATVIGTTVGNAKGSGVTTDSGIPVSAAQVVTSRE